MAYVSKETKAQIRPAVRQIMRKYDVKGSLQARDNRVLVLTLKQGSIDFTNNYKRTTKARKVGTHFQVNHDQFDKQFTGRARKFLSEVVPVMTSGIKDQSDPTKQAYYVDIEVGKRDEPYVYQRHGTENEETRAPGGDKPKEPETKKAAKVKKVYASGKRRGRPPKAVQKEPNHNGNHKNLKKVS